MMADNFNLTFEGHNGETRTVTIPMVAGHLVSALDTNVAAVSAAGLLRRSVTSGVQSFASGGPYAENVRVEMGLRLHWRDNTTGRTGYFTIPAPDWDALTVTGDSVDLAGGTALPALITELETNGRTPYDNNTFTITSAEIVGRK